MRQRIWVVFFLFLFTALLGLGCDKQLTAAEQQYASKLDRTNNLIENQPASPVPYSMDRFILDQRLLRFNDPSRMTYLYVTLLDGTWLKVTIIGKLTSTSKRLSQQEQVFRVRNPASNCRENDDSLSCFMTINGQAPDEMGVFGSSEPAKVGITTAGSLIEFGGFSSYIYSETPLAFTNLEKKVIEIVVEADEADRQNMIEQLQKAQKEALKRAK